MVAVGAGGIKVGVAVGGTGVAVGGTSVGVGGIKVGVGGTGVAVGGSGVGVGGTGVAVGALAMAPAASDSGPGVVSSPADAPEPTGENSFSSPVGEAAEVGVDAGSRGARGGKPVVDAVPSGVWVAVAVG